MLSIVALVEKELTEPISPLSSTSDSPISAMKSVRNGIKIRLSIAQVPSRYLSPSSRDFERL